MNLLWHIVRKDLRRMSVPVLVWNAFVLASNVWFRGATPALVGHVPTEVSIWVQDLSIWSGLFVGIDLALTYVLAGAVVLEDRVVGSTQFWPTRPIEPLRLVAAKVVCVLLCFAVLPTAVLLPVWFSVEQTTQVVGAAVRFATVHAGVALFGIAFAALVRTTAELIFATLAAVLLWFAGMWLRLVPPVWPVLFGLRTPATQFLVPGLLVVMAAVTLVQFVRRRARDSWVLLAIGIVVCSSIGVRLSFAVISRVATPPSTTIPSGKLPVEVPPSFEADSRYRTWPSIVVTTPWTSPRFLAPVFARDQDGLVVLALPSWWANSAGSLLLPSERHPAVLRWPLTFTVRAPSRKTDLVGALEMWRAHAVIVAEMPLVVGRRSASGNGVLRILSVQKLTSGEHEVCFEERTIETVSRWYPAAETPLQPWVDAYFLVNGAEGEVRSVSISNPEVVSMDSQAVRFRRFTIRNAWDPEHQHLVKVRIMADERFQIPISIHGVVDTSPYKPDAEGAKKQTP